MSQRFRALASLLLLMALMPLTLTSHAQSRAADTLSGTIHINLQGNNQDVWQQVAAAYMKVHPICRLARATGSVNFAGSLRIISGKKNSFHLPMKVKMARAASPGVITGSTTFQ